MIKYSCERKQIVKYFTSLLGFVFCFIWTMISAHADTYVGMMLGPSFVNNNFGTEFVFGGDIGFMVRPDLAVGVYATHETLNSSANASETTLAAEVNFFPLSSRPFYLGAKAGTGFISSSFLGSNGSETDFLFGPAVGFNLPIQSSPLTVGIEANVLFLESSSTDVFINVLGTASFHF
jgi:hypothetical protein